MAKKETAKKEIGAKLGFEKEDLLQYGPHMAKISASAIKARKNNKKGKTAKKICIVF